MGTKGPSLIILLFLFLGHHANAGVCKEGCPSPNQVSKYKFVEGQVYNYNIDSVVTVYLSGSKQQTQIKLNGQVQLFAQGNCQYTLTISKLVVTSPDGKKLPQGNEFTKPVKFILSNDELTPELCVDGTDSDFSLNVKRGIISLLQSSEGKSYETDIFGVCPTNILKAGSGDSLVITKTRDLNSCSHRETLSDGFIKGYFNEASGVKTTPILNGEYSLEQRINNGILESAQSTEQYNYLPFSSPNSGARAKVVSKLTFVKAEAKAAPPIAKQKEDTILYENPSDTTGNAFEPAKTTLQNLIKTFNPQVGKNSAAQFSELVRLLRHLKKGELLKLFAAVQSGTVDSNKDLARKIFLDALFRAGTADSVAATADISAKKTFTEQEQRLAYLSFNLAESVTKDSLISAAKSLGPQSPREAFLGIGTLINKFCTTNGCTAADLKELLTKYSNNLGGCKPTTRVQEDKYVSVLKGIRNANVLFEPVLKSVIECTSNKASTRVRVAALQALSGDACNKKLQTLALNTLKNRLEDSEIRIQAYLAFVGCPNAGNANEIKALLDDEPVYQVGSFINSHLASLRGSADPHREALRRVYGNIKPTYRFPSDIRKYSFNKELSYSIDSLGAGASIDSNVIYSQNGFLPRSTHLNLTGELFGNVFNILELNLRQENMEQVMEHYFGPKGELSFSSGQELYNNLLSTYTQVKEKTEQRIERRRRATRAEVNTFRNAVQLSNDVFSDVEVDLSFKLFGTELYFLSMASEVPNSPQEFIERLFKSVDEKIADAKNFGKVYDGQTLFMDIDLVYPTSFGFPLKLALQGSAATRVEAAGQLDVKTFRKSPKFSFKFVPSYSVQVDGELTVDAYGVEAGLKVVGNLHSSTGVQVDFTKEPGAKKFDLKLSFPFAHQELLSMDTNALFIVREKFRETIEIPVAPESLKNRKDFSDCFDQFKPYVGVTICPGYDLNLGEGPNSVAFPFAGPNSLKLKLEVEKAYTVSGSYDDSNPKHPVIKYVFDTPGSDPSRQTTLQVEWAYDNDYFAKIAVDSPRKTASVEAGLKRNSKEFALYAAGRIDKDEYLAKVGFDVSGNEVRSEYTPIIVIKDPKSGANNLGGYTVDGKVVVERNNGNSKYIFNSLKVTTPTGAPYIVNGFISRNGGRVEFDLKYDLSSDKKSAQVKGAFENTIEKEGVGKFLLDLALLSDFHDLANGQVKFYYERQKGSVLNSEALLVVGKDLSDANKNRFHFKQNANYAHENKELTSLSADTKLELPFIPLSLNLNNKYQKNAATFDLQIDSAPHKLKVVSTNKYNTKTKGDFDIELLGEFDNHNGKLIATRVVGDKVSDVNAKLTSSCGFELGLKGKFSNRFTEDRANINFDATAVLPNKKDKPYGLNFVLLTSPTEAKSNAKLTEGTTEWMTYDFKVTRGDSTKGTFNVFVKEILKGNGELNSVKRKGTLSALIEMDRIDRKLKLETEFNVQQPTYDVNTKFYYNFGKDDTKKIEFITKSQIENKNIDSKNTLIILTEKYSFNILAKEVGSTANGNVNANFELGLPTGRKVAGSVDRHTDFQEQKGNGKLKIELSDVMPNGDRRSVVIDRAVKNADFNAKIWDMTHKVTYTGFDKKDVNVFNTFTRVANGEAHKSTIGIKVDGSMITNPLIFNLASDEASETKADYKLNGKYGQALDFDLLTKYNIEQKDKPSTYDFNLVINVPDTKLKKVKVDLSSYYLEPSDENGQYDARQQANMEFGEKRLGFDGNLKGNLKKGEAKVALTLPESEPVNVKVGFTRENTDETQHATIDVNANFGQARTYHLTADMNSGTNDFALKANLQTPLEKGKDIALQFNWKVSGGNTYNTNIKFDVDQKAYGYNGMVILSELSPTVSVEITYPDKTTKLYLGLTKFDETKYSVLVKIENLLDYNLDLNGEVLFKGPSNFYIKLNLDSTNLKKVSIEINSKPTGKGVEFKGTQDGKNLISGSADFTVKDERGRTIIEGQGNVKLYEEQQSTSFTFIRNKFDAQKDGETGVSFVLDGRLGVKNIISELKLTDKTALFKHTVCETKKQCISVDLRSSLHRTDITDFTHELVISVDLRQLGYTHEFGLKADTSKKGSLVDHTVDMHLQSQDKSKYQYSLYIHKSSAGVTLTLPKRTISLESQYTFPSDNVFGKYDSSLVFYLDKVNNPAGKSSLSFKGALDRASTNVIKGNGEIRLENPSMKALAIGGSVNLDGDNQRANGKLELDIFQQKNNQLVANVNYENTDRSGKGFNITTDAKLTSKGLGLELGCDGHAALNYDTRVLSFGSSGVVPNKDFTFGTYLYASEKSLELYGRVFNEELVKVLASYDLQKRTATFSSIFKTIGNTPFEVTSKVDGFTTASVSVAKDKLVDVKGNFELGKLATVKVVGNGKELFNGKISLEQANFLTSDFKTNEEDTKAFLTQLKTTIKTENDASRKILTEKYENLRKTVETQFKTLQSSFPDFTKLQEEYKKQLEKLSAELQTDPTMKKIAEFYTKIVSSISTVLENISKILLSYYEKVSAAISDLYKQVEQAFNEKIYPTFKELYNQIEKLAFSLYEEAVSLISSVFERVTKALKGFEEDFKKISSTLSELFKSVGTISKEYFEEVEKNLKDLYNLLIQQLQALPGIEALKEKFNEFFAQYNIQDQVAATLKEFLNAIKPNMPTPEWQAFIEKLNDYLYKKLTKQPVKDSEALKGLLEAGIQAVRSLTKLIGDYRKDKDYSGWLQSLPISLEGFKRISYIWNVKFSPFNCLREGNCFSIRDILNYRPYGFELSELVPPFKLHAHIGDGQHIFTFDERHITFPGSCSYVLAQDVANGNFTLVANLAGGKLKSLTLFDRADTVEIDAEGIVKLNGAPATLPVRSHDIHAWRRYHSVSFITTYGVNVMCTTDLRVCHVTVSGYYHGRLRGLLGNGNYEPYDDFLLPNGQIAKDGVELGNAYGVGKCTPVAPIQHNHVSEKLCNEFFSAGSPMQLAFLLTNTKNYKEACEHATSTATDKLDAACNIALTYASAAFFEKIPVRLPNQCVKCQVGGKQVDIGDDFEVETPSKEADGVIVIDTAVGKPFPELVQGLVTELKKELKTRGITDVRVAVIGYNNKEKYSSLYSNGGTLDFDGKLPQNLNGPEYEKPIKTGDERVDKFSEQVFTMLDKLREDFVSTSDAVAFRESIDFPFRPTASKFIICVRSDELAYSSPLKQALSKALEGQIKLLGYSVHSFVPLVDFNLSGAGDASKVVGFNTNNVVQLADGRKRPEGSPDLRGKLQFKPDLGSDAILNSGGFVFALNNYLTTEGKAKKQFIQTMTAAIADQVSRTKQKFECVCIVKYGMFASQICRATETTMLPPVKKVAARG